MPPDVSRGCKLTAAFRNGVKAQHQMMLSMTRIMSTTDIRENGEITPPRRLLEPERNPAKDISHFGEKTGSGIVV